MTACEVTVYSSSHTLIYIRSLGFFSVYISVQHSIALATAFLSLEAWGKYSSLVTLSSDVSSLTTSGYQLETYPQSTIHMAPIALITPTPHNHLTPAPGTAPNCHPCGKKAVLKRTQQSNRKGNAGRPYYKRPGCGKFLVFNDQRGNDPLNPACTNCGVSSKMQIAGPEKEVPRGLHYVCRLGRCSFYDTVKDGRGAQFSLGSEWLVEKFKRFSIA